MLGGIADFGGDILEFGGDTLGKGSFELVGEGVALGVEAVGADGSFVRDQSKTAASTTRKN